MVPTSLQSLRHATRARASSWLGILLLALVLPSLWGSWHRVAHASALAVVGQAQQVLSAGDAHTPGAEDCRLLDQAACADGLTVAMAPVPLVFGTPPQRAAALGHAVPVRMVASYAARAPPLHPAA